MQYIHFPVDNTSFIEVKLTGTRVYCCKQYKVRHLASVRQRVYSYSINNKRITPSGFQIVNTNSILRIYDFCCVTPTQRFVSIVSWSNITRWGVSLRPKKLFGSGQIVWVNFFKVRVFEHPQTPAWLRHCPFRVQTKLVRVIFFSLHVFLPLPTHLTPATTTFLQADTQSSPFLPSTCPKCVSIIRKLLYNILLFNANI